MGQSRVRVPSRSGGGDPDEPGCGFSASSRGPRAAERKFPVSVWYASKKKKKKKIALTREKRKQPKSTKAPPTSTKNTPKRRKKHPTFFFPRLRARKNCSHTQHSNFISAHWWIWNHHRRVWLRHVDLSKTPSGAFCRRVRPGSEMAGQNDLPKGPAFSFLNYQNGCLGQNGQNDPIGLVF